MAATKRINSKSIIGRGGVALLLGTAGMGLSAGCAPAVNPFHVDRQPIQRTTTASVEGAEAFEGTGTLRTRSGPPTTVSAESGAVLHVTLYFEDPTIREGIEEDLEEGQDDGSMVWTAEDYFQFLPLAPGRFLFDTITWPIAAVMDPPWTVHVSDGDFGRQSRDGHDHAEHDEG